MLKRWLSVKKKPKDETEQPPQTSDGLSLYQTPYHTPRMSPELISKPLPKPTPIKTKERSRESSRHSSQFHLPIGDKQVSVETHSGNETLPSMLSTSIDTVMDMDSPILFTTCTEDMPYGDGSNKVFGFENFGNTCYCNSVLQCLYNLTDFRVQILQYPKRIPEGRRKRKTEMPGKKPRFFNESSFDSKDHHNHHQPQHLKRNNEIASNSGNSNNHSTSASETTPASNSGGIEKNENVNENGSSHNTNNNYKTNNNDSHTTNNSSNSNDKSTQLDNEHNGSREKNLQSLPKGLPGGLEKQLGPSNTLKGGDNTNPFTNLPFPKQDVSQPVHSALITSGPFNEKIHENTQKVIVGRINANSSQGADLLYTGNYKTVTSDQDLRVAPGEGEHLSSPIISQNGKKNQQQHHHHTQHNNHYSTEQRKKSALIKGPVLNVDYVLHESGEANLYTGLKDIFESVTENLSLTGVVSPIKFVDILKKENVLFNTMMHQDAHEFLNFLLNELSDYLEKDMQSRNQEYGYNFVKYLFQGTLTNRVKCFTCDNITSRDEPFLDFPIEVNEDGDTDVQALLRNFEQREMLSGSNKFYCNECCGLQEAERRVGLKQLPHTLALHLKRFKYSEAKNSNIKLFNKVYYPLNLSVCTTFSDSVSKSYELSGIVVHMGGGPQHGHYVSLCKNDNFGWLLFDDETVESVSESTVLNFVGDATTLTTAYVLFYRESPANRNAGIANDIHVKRNHEENIEKLLKYDEWIRTTSMKAPNMSENNTVEEATAKEPPVTPPVIPKVERKASNSSIKLTRPRSKLFNFMKSEKTLKKVDTD
ncbi:UBP13 (YBL067C) and UBP9 (YER098W) [Zygosaccharomyces parabailii]|uniref:Ubiquitin carboxyl-terminal hydrolase n=1 Tax=Zygosaccharomyces bailii (strain CLIB 213 / ATCC 58445 / CBS 680 / BCRC 21525 / NBRC 1098 / NCYC 1416 / NRRL Y-2227) TaxID=1333698 RepID=A0A8J2X9F5_ZYGB2|nr:UBP13 (YBL067C) and UBP9 (YER098W) [Zygosaccharomyces parabailii]CDF90762.1 ZYBA0S08-02432g1_1 [Zygosaccharomyces bailii CLIB 213]